MSDIAKTSEALGANAPPSGNTRRLIIFSAIILLVTATAKILSYVLFRGSWETRDPVFMLPTNAVLLGVAIIEIAVAIYCLRSREETSALIALAWISTCFLLYRGVLVLIGTNLMCPCLGTLFSRLPIRGKTTDQLIVALLGYLLIASYGPLIIRYRASATAPTPCSL